MYEKDSDDNVAAVVERGENEMTMDPPEELPLH